MRSAESFDFAPSLYHERLAGGIRPCLRFAGGDVRAWQAKMRRELRRRLGLDRLPRTIPPPLAPRTLWRRDTPLGRIEKIVFRAEASVEIPAYVCLPKQVRAPYPFWICLQGHTTGMHKSIAVDRADEAKSVPSNTDNDFALGCLQRGQAALCLEQRSFGERGETRIPQPIDYLCHQAAMHALLLGTTLIGERVADVRRAIDYLASRGDADPVRIGILGSSGGGTVSLYAAALIPQLHFAMPAVCFSGFKESLQKNFHCVCNYVPGIATVADMGDIAGLVAPRPLVIVNGRDDGIFPLAAARREFAHAKRIYTALGAAGRCRLVVGEGGHRFYADAAWPVMFKLQGCAIDRSR